jgi:hypothetical protein
MDMVATKIANIGNAAKTKSVTADPSDLEANHTIHRLLKDALKGWARKGPHNNNQPSCH